jgi:hypothetical protein
MVANVTEVEAPTRTNVSDPTDPIGLGAVLKSHPVFDSYGLVVREISDPQLFLVFSEILKELKEIKELLVEAL